MTFRYTPKGGEGENHIKIWGKNFPAVEIASTKALRSEQHRGVPGSGEETTM